MLKSFFALLEMVRKRLVVAIQKKIFDTISVWKRPENSEV
jgi:chromatin segregation and condensation protein Rec8/ScpA/Scc1 (kleisin family)